jgi:hypothetical protein
VRTEQAIFDELADLCCSPGYVHAIAALCLRDNMVFYRGEMKPEDTRHLFSPTRLIRIELSTLLGLMVKKEIDYTLPSRSTLRALVQRTEELLDELHRAIDSACFPKLDATTFAHITPDVFKSGHSFREPIFYAGESAYSFQYHDFSAKKYLNDNNWIETNKGFSINAARDVVQAIANLQNAKLTALLHELRNVPIEERAVLPGFSFTLEEVSNASHVNEPVAAKVLAAFAVSSGSRNEGFRTLHDFNAMNATPILRAPDGTFLSFQQYSLAEALYDSPFYWMLEDKSYINEANDHRGKFTEAFSEERVTGMSFVMPSFNEPKASGRVKSTYWSFSAIEPLCCRPNRSDSHWKLGEAMTARSKTILKKVSRIPMIRDTSVRDYLTIRIAPLWPLTGGGFKYLDLRSCTSFVLSRTTIQH